MDADGDLAEISLILLGDRDKSSSQQVNGNLVSLRCLTSSEYSRSRPPASPGSDFSIVLLVERLLNLLAAKRHRSIWRVIRHASVAVTVHDLYSDLNVSDCGECQQ